MKNVAIKPNDVLTPQLEADLDALALPPALLPGESIERYQLLRQAILSDIDPQSVIEWLLAIDVAELTWEIDRYRLMRQKVLLRHREQAIEQGLRRIDLADIPPEGESNASREIRRNAISWREDQNAALEIEARLAAHGMDQHTISAECLIQAREAFFLFQALIDAAQSRRASILREIKLQRASVSLVLGDVGSIARFEGEPIGGLCAAATRSVSLAR